MSKATRILNKYEYKELLLNGNPQWENFYKDELIGFLEVAKELLKENKQLKEDLRISKSNEETYSLEMQEITKILGLDEDTLFDDVKECVKLLNEEHNKKLRVFMAYNFYHSILRDLEEWLKKRIKYREEEKKDWEDDIPLSNWEEQKTCMEEILIIKNEILELEDTLDKIQELKEKYK